MKASPIAITGCGVVSPQAMTPDELANRLAGSEPVTGPNRPRRLPLDRFDPRRYFGAHGFKYLTPATQYALAAAQMALSDARVSEASYTPQQRGVVVGTNFGVHGVLAAMDHVILDGGAEHLRPMEAPNFSVNIPASQLSMKHKFTAFNVTLTTAQVAGVEALLVAADALRAGRASVVLVCAAEGEPAQGLESAFAAPLAEGGACALVLERLDDARQRGAAVRGEIWNGASRFLAGDAAGATEPSVEVMEQALSEVLPAGSGPLHLFAPAGGDPFSDGLRVAAGRVLHRSGRVATAYDVTCRFGECGSVSPLLQVPAMCALRAGQALVAAVSLQGHVVALSGCGHGLLAPAGTPPQAAASRA
jgi:3-oxoacyl-[acyl-carrier-protein] synthase II